MLGRLAGKACVNVERVAFQRWDGMSSHQTLPEDKQEEIVKNFTEAMEFQGMAVLIY